MINIVGLGFTVAAHERRLGRLWPWRPLGSSLVIPPRERYVPTLMHQRCVVSLPCRLVFDLFTSFGYSDSVLRLVRQHC